ncbi:MAG: CHAD domain-containing protein [Planctomycetia bacterium]|nr:CHAD domain-containing protein [Planctomycetia bacterium]
MPAGKKWIEGTAPEQPLSEAARIALRDRLAAVSYWVERAAGEPVESEDGAEPVHQLRVSTRRAAAAIKACRELLPRRKSRRLKRLLGKVRRAANEARDLDVLLARYREASTPKLREVGASLDEVQGRRAQAQKALGKAARRFRRRRFADRAEKLLARVRWRDADSPEPTLAAAARSELARLAGKFLDAARGGSSPEGLHALRIRGKALRYAVEVFAGALPDLRETIYPALVEMQDLLGAANDHATAVALFRAWSRSSGDPLRFEGLLVDESRAWDEARWRCAARLGSPAFAELKRQLESICAGGGVGCAE